MRYCGLVIDEDVFNDDDMEDGYDVLCAEMRRTDVPRPRLTGRIMPIDRKWFKLEESK